MKKFKITEKNGNYNTHLQNPLIGDYTLCMMTLEGCDDFDEGKDTMANIDCPDCITIIKSIKRIELKMLAGYKPRKIKEKTQSEPPSGIINKISFPKDMNNLEYENGWLNPDGKFYPCMAMGHEQLARDMASNDQQLIEWGYIRISSGMMGLYFQKSPKKIATQAQINKLFDYAEKHDGMSTFNEFMEDHKEDSNEY